MSSSILTHQIFTNGCVSCLHSGVCHASCARLSYACHLISLSIYQYNSDPLSMSSTRLTLCCPRVTERERFQVCAVLFHQCDYSKHFCFWCTIFHLKVQSSRIFRVFLFDFLHHDSVSRLVTVLHSKSSSSISTNRSWKTRFNQACPSMLSKWIPSVVSLA